MENQMIIMLILIGLMILVFMIYKLSLTIQDTLHEVHGEIIGNITKTEHIITNFVDKVKTINTSNIGELQKLMIMNTQQIRKQMAGEESENAIPYLSDQLPQKIFEKLEIPELYYSESDTSSENEPQESKKAFIEELNDEKEKIDEKKPDEEKLDEEKPDEEEINEEKSNEEKKSDEKKINEEEKPNLKSAMEYSMNELKNMARHKGIGLMEKIDGKYRPLGKKELYEKIKNLL
jgi:hypothetical protein